MIDLRFADRGKGFSLPAGDLERLETSGTHTRSGGGLGLSLILRIIDFHGGTLKIESRPGGGAMVATSWKLVPKG